MNRGTQIALGNLFVPILGLIQGLTSILLPSRKLPRPQCLCP